MHIGIFLKPVKRQVGQSDAGDAIHPDRVAHPDGVEPTAATRSACSGAEFAALAPQGFSISPVDFGGEGSASNAGRVSLGNPDHLLNVLGTDA